LWLGASLIVCAYSIPRAAAQLDWTTEVVDPNTIDSDSWESGITSIQLDSAGNPWISYVTGPVGGDNFHLKLASFDGSGWTTTIVDTENWGHAWLALDSGDIPHISFRQSPLYGQGILRYATWTGSEWAVETVDPTPDLYSTSIAVDELDRPHIAYGSGVYPNWALKHAQWTGSQWDIEDVDAGGYQIREATSIAIDTLGRPHISYTLCCVDGLRQVKYAHWNGSAWEFDVLDSVNTPLSTSIALDSSDRPHVAYTMGGLDGISYASKMGDEWQTELITTDRIWYARLALGSDDEPRICYYHADDGALVFAMRQRGDWMIQVVDDDPSPNIRIGRFPAIAVGDDDSIHISYYSHAIDGPNQLKYARAAAPCFGDLDGDGDVDLTDLAVLLSNYGMPDGASYEDGDLDGDGDVDLSDLAALLSVYGNDC
jgi:hypothetical protein